MNLEYHKYAELFPLIQNESFDEFKKDIEHNGLREPIWIFEGKILDGRNRYRACLETGTAIKTREYTGDDPIGFVVSLNLKRRHLDTAQRAMVASRLANMQHGGDRKSEDFNVEISTLVSQSEAANLLNVSRESVVSAKKVIDKGTEELIQKVDAGEIAVSTAATIAELPKEEQAEIVARGEKEILEAAKEIKTQKAIAKREEIALIKKNNPVIIPEGKYSCIVIDPPWEMKKIDRDVRPNQVEFDYPTMSESELSEFEVSSMSADNCHLFCWTTHKHLPSALRLLEAWGFRYVCTFVWHKNGGFQPIGLPQYNCEFVLYARKGTPSFIDTKAFNCCFDAPRREHSRKPDEFYEVIARVTEGPRIDVFSREKRAGFSQFGNEIDRFVA